jgi:hypothetical protein
MKYICEAALDGRCAYTACYHADPFYTSNKYVHSSCKEYFDCIAITPEHTRCIPDPRPEGK